MTTFAVLGPGGVGGLLGGLLARAGNDVDFIARDETVARLREQGLSVRSQLFGDFHVQVRAAPALETPVDACFVTVKATQLESGVERVPAQALGDGLAVPLLNGLDHVAVLRRRYPPEQVVAGTIRVQAARVAPGEIEHRSPFAPVELAAGPENHERVEALAGQLRGAGLEVAVRDDEAAMLWDKLALLAPLALLTTHAGAPVGVVREQRGDEAPALIREIAAVARADGGAVDADAVIATFQSLPDAMESSMQLDAAAGLPTELDAIGGAVLRAADRQAIDAPLTRRLVSELHG